MLDPFAGSGTTGIAANLLGRRFLGVEREENFLKLARERRREIENFSTFDDLRSRLKMLPAAFPREPAELILREEFAEETPF